MDLKSKLLTGNQPLLGSFLSIPSSALMEMLGRSGYDFAILDGEHGVFSPESTENCLRAAAAVNLPCIVRVAHLDAKLIGAALDLGADGVQVPQVETSAQANMVVHCSQFPPIGGRGLSSSTRAAAYGFRSRSVMKDIARQQLLISIQIESRAGVDNLPDILKTNGIDVVFIGTTDLSSDYGFDSANEPGMVTLVDKLISAIVSAGKVPGVHVSDWSQIGRLQQLGVRYFTGSAPLVIREAFVNQVKDFAAKVKRSRGA
jgi:4-hydroxy-2-oxoheptanedioate aldolase